MTTFYRFLDWATGGSATRWIVIWSTCFLLPAILVTAAVSWATT